MSQIKSINDKLSKFDEQIQQMQDQQAQLKKWRGQIIDEKSEIESKDVFKRLERLINDFSNLEEAWENIKGEIIILNGQDANWPDRWKEQKKPLLFIQIAQSFSGDRINSMTIEQLIRQVAQIDRNLEKKEGKIFKNLKER